MKWTVDDFLYSQKWSHEYARKSLPVLVARAEKYKGVSESSIPDFTYGDLAALVAGHNYAHPIHSALGSVGHALKELGTRSDWNLGKIPPIQLLVWSKGKGCPGDDAFGFIDISKDEARKMPLTVRQFTARSIRADILSFPHWREVLSKFGLEPQTVNLPSVKEVVGSKNFGTGVESEDHKRLKFYCGSYYQALGIKGNFVAKYEERLLSGDVADVILEGLQDRQRICIEVKSHISNTDDLIRGIFQCVKYAAVLDSQERYEFMRNPTYKVNKLQTLFVTESDLPDALKQLCDLLGVPVRIVKIPADYNSSNNL